MILYPQPPLRRTPSQGAPPSHIPERHPRRSSSLSSHSPPKTTMAGSVLTPIASVSSTSSSATITSVGTVKSSDSKGSNSTTETVLSGNGEYGGPEHRTVIRVNRKKTDKKRKSKKMEKADSHGQGGHTDSHLHHHLLTFGHSFGHHGHSHTRTQDREEEYGQDNESGATSGPAGATAGGRRRLPQIPPQQNDPHVSAAPVPQSPISPAISFNSQLLPQPPGRKPRGLPANPRDTEKRRGVPLPDGNDLETPTTTKSSLRNELIGPASVASETIPPPSAPSLISSSPEQMMTGPPSMPASNISTATSSVHNTSVHSTLPTRTSPRPSLPTPPQTSSLSQHPNRFSQPPPYTPPPPRNHSTSPSPSLHSPSPSSVGSPPSPVPTSSTVPQTPVLPARASRASAPNATGALMPVGPNVYSQPVASTQPSSGFYPHMSLYTPQQSHPTPASSLSSSQQSQQHPPPGMAYPSAVRLPSVPTMDLERAERSERSGRRASSIYVGGAQPPVPPPRGPRLGHLKTSSGPDADGTPSTTASCLPSSALNLQFPSNQQQQSGWKGDSGSESGGPHSAGTSASSDGAVSVPPATSSISRPASSESIRLAPPTPPQPPPRQSPLLRSTGELASVTGFTKGTGGMSQHPAHHPPFVEIVEEAEEDDYDEDDEDDEDSEETEGSDEVMMEELYDSGEWEREREELERNLLRIRDGGASALSVQTGVSDGDSILDPDMGGNPQGSKNRKYSQMEEVESSLPESPISRDFEEAFPESSTKSKTYTPTHVNTDAAASSSAATAGPSASTPRSRSPAPSNLTVSTTIAPSHRSSKTATSKLPRSDSPTDASVSSQSISGQSTGGPSSASTTSPASPHPGAPNREHFPSYSPMMETGAIKKSPPHIPPTLTHPDDPKGAALGLTQTTSPMSPMDKVSSGGSAATSTSSKGGGWRMRLSSAVGLPAPNPKGYQGFTNPLTYTREEGMIAENKRKQKEEETRRKQNDQERRRKESLDLPEGPASILRRRMSKGPSKDNRARQSGVPSLSATTTVAPRTSKDSGGSVEMEILSPSTASATSRGSEGDGHDPSKYPPAEPGLSTAMLPHPFAGSPPTKTIVESSSEEDLGSPSISAGSSGGGLSKAAKLLGVDQAQAEDILSRSSAVSKLLEDETVPPQTKRTLVINQAANALGVPNKEETESSANIRRQSGPIPVPPRSPLRPTMSRGSQQSSVRDSLDPDGPEAAMMRRSREYEDVKSAEDLSLGHSALSLDNHRRTQSDLAGDKERFQRSVSTASSLYSQASALHDSKKPPRHSLSLSELSKSEAALSRQPKHSLTPIDGSPPPSPSNYEYAGQARDRTSVTTIGSSTSSFSGGSPDPKPRQTRPRGWSSVDELSGRPSDSSDVYDKEEATERLSDKHQVFTLSQSRSVSGSTTSLPAGTGAGEERIPRVASGSKIPLNNQLTPEAFEEARAKSETKRKEKRRRTMEELIETEEKYATDMVITRDVWLAKAKGMESDIIRAHLSSKFISSDAEESTNSEPSNSRPPRATPSLSTRSGSFLANAPMTSSDSRAIFGNIEEIAQLAEEFAVALRAARGGGNGEEEEPDQIGTVFMEFMPRIQDVYSKYCSRHTRAINRLAELEPNLGTYVAECKELGASQTNAWDLSSLLIKPVQRCLKYPLLLDQLVLSTSMEHVDIANLRKSNHQIKVVADHINEAKRRQELVNRIVGNEKRETKSKDRRPSNRPKSASTEKDKNSFKSTVTKKLFKSQQQTRKTVGLGIEREPDTPFEALVDRFNYDQEMILRFLNETKAWSQSTGRMLQAQSRLLQSWRQVYAPLDGEQSVARTALDLMTGYAFVLQNLIDAPWRRMDAEIHTSLTTKISMLLTLYDKPRAVIDKRNRKQYDHDRVVARQRKNGPGERPIDDGLMESWQTFVALTEQLTEELPIFMSSIRKYFDVILTNFATLQANFFATMRADLSTFARLNLTNLPDETQSEDLEQDWWESHRPISQTINQLVVSMMELSDGEGPAQRYRRESAATTSSHGTFPRDRHSSSSSGMSGSVFASPKRQQSLRRGTMDSQQERPPIIEEDRSPVVEELVTPATSSTLASRTSSSNTPDPRPPPTPPSPSINTGVRPMAQQGDGSAPRSDKHMLPPLSLPGSMPESPTVAYDGSRRASRNMDGTEQSQGSGNNRSSFASSTPSFTFSNASSSKAGTGANTSIASHSAGGPASSASSASVSAGDDLTVLYSAICIGETGEVTGQSHNGWPLLTFSTGDLFEVMREEADEKSTDGNGWLFGKNEKDEKGWARSHYFTRMAFLSGDFP